MNDSDVLKRLESMEAADRELMKGSEEEYLAEIKAFLEGQDFLRLGHGINSGSWNSVMMTVRRMREKCKGLGIPCFDRWLVGIRDASGRHNREEALQIMTRITAKRVQLRKLFLEEK